MKIVLIRCINSALLIFSLNETEYAQASGKPHIS